MQPPEDGTPPQVPLPADAVTGADPGPPPDLGPDGAPVRPMDRLRYGRNWSEPRVRSRAEAALLVNTIAALLCFGFIAVAGVVLAAIAFVKSDDRPEQARTLVRASWICLVASLAVSVVLLITGVVNPVIAWISHVVSLF